MQRVRCQCWVSRISRYERRWIRDGAHSLDCPRYFDRCAAGDAAGRSYNERERAAGEARDKRGKG